MSLLYSKMKIFHYQKKLDSLNKDKDVLPPIHIRIKPTNKCNHNCKYCAYRSSNLQLGKDMKVHDMISEHRMIELIDDFVDLDVKAITFSGGGDPFCYPHLTKALNKLIKTNIKFAALTNGSKMNQEQSELFALNGTWLRVSMDGWDDESYTFYRNVKHGEFTKIMKNMENFKKYNGKCYLGVSLIADKNNASHIFESISNIKNIGADSVKVSPCIVDNDGQKNNLYHKPIFDLIKDQIAQSINMLADSSFEIYDSYHELDTKFDKKYLWCPYIQILPVIGADMNVYSCQDKAYNLENGLIGSIKDKSFKEFWMSDKDKFFKINPSLDCNHHCVSNIKNSMIYEYINVDYDHMDFV